MLSITYLCRNEINTIDMKNKNEVCEPAITYTVDTSVRNNCVESKPNANNRRDCMTVDEYINLIKEELDKRYENI